MRAEPMRRPALLLALLACGGLAAGREEPSGEGREDRSRRVAAIDLGLAWLARTQRRDGSIGEGEEGIVGITALSVLAFYARGHQDGRGPYGEVIRRAVDFLLAQSLPAPRLGMPKGYIFYAGDHDSRMHGHGYATQALVLAYGGGRLDDERTKRVKERIALAVGVIEYSQSFTGGWYYDPNPASGHEGSVTVTVVQALRLASEAGFVVDRGVVDRGLRYLHKSQKEDGSFKYSLLQDSSTAALTAAAITAMHGFGEYYTEPVKRGLDFLRDEYADPERIEWPYYAHYYAAQAFYRAGGRPWADWEDRVVPRIVDAQESQGDEAGSWPDNPYGRMRRSYGRALSTSLSCLTLAVPDGLLPLFQK
jgi:hypothetical protein